jgi:hypothetical protein
MLWYVLPFENVTGIAATMVGCGGEGVHSLLAIYLVFIKVGCVFAITVVEREVGGALGFDRGSVTFLEHQNAYVVIQVTFLAFSLACFVLIGTYGIV